MIHSLQEYKYLHLLSVRCIGSNFLKFHMTINEARKFVFTKFQFGRDETAIIIILYKIYIVS